MKVLLTPLFFITLCSTVFSYCGTPGKTNNTVETGPEKIIYHASRCFGTCPKIDMQIDNKRNIMINREFYVSKSGIDSSQSGHFKGILDTTSYNELLRMLKSSDYKNLKFPDIDCCDGVVTTIIVYEAGKKTFLKSMTPPAEAEPLISYLHKLGTELKLEKTTENFSIEE